MNTSMKTRAPSDLEASTTFAQKVKADFPVLMRPKEAWGGKDLVYLDSAATTQKPTVVLNAMDRFYRESYGTVRRGVYRLSEKATAAYEGCRKQVANLIGASSPNEIIYTRGTTESLNLIAYSLARSRLKPGDEILLSQIEHHANIVPWQIACEMSGAVIKVIPCNDLGELDQATYLTLLNARTMVVSVNHVSNALGTVNPIAAMAKAAKAVGALFVVDGAQSIAHMPVHVGDLGIDFFAFSGHKMFGPTGIGILWGRYDLLAAMPPFQGGGDMIQTVTFEKTTYQTPPHRFEAGTPAIAEVIGLSAAVDYLQQVGLSAIHAHEQALLAYGTQVLQQVPGLRLIGQAKDKGGILSFSLEGVHPHDIGTLLDEEGIAIRAGHHCAQPTMARFGVPATARASFGPYNTPADIDALASALRRIHAMFN
jgi:cysteine desulfurase / selenocysteine lyase